MRADKYRMFTRIKCTVPHGQSIVSLGEIKQHLFISHDDEDPYLESLADVATALIDGPKGIGVSIAPATYVASLDTLPVVVEIPLSPVRSIVSISVDGIAVDPTNYRLETGRAPAVLYCLTPAIPSSGFSVFTGDRVKITFTAGYDDVPVDLKQAALLLIGHWYRNREATTDVRLDETPLAVELILSRYRAVVA